MLILKHKKNVPSPSEILKGLSNARSEWSRKKPLEKYNYLYGIGRLGWGWLHLQVFQDELSNSRKRYLNLFLPGLHPILILYTLYYFIPRGEFIKSFPSLCMLGCSVAVSQSYQNNLKYNADFCRK